MSLARGAGGSNPSGHLDRPLANSTESRWRLLGALRAEIGWEGRRERHREGRPRQNEAHFLDVDTESRGTSRLSARPPGVTAWQGGSARCA